MTTTCTYSWISEINAFTVSIGCLFTSVLSVKESLVLWTLLNFSFLLFLCMRSLCGFLVGSFIYLFWRHPFQGFNADLLFLLFLSLFFSVFPRDRIKCLARQLLLWNFLFHDMKSCLFSESSLQYLLKGAIILRYWSKQEWITGGEKKSVCISLMYMNICCRHSF